MSALTEKAKEHFASILSTNVVEVAVPEWDTVLYFRPWTASERQQVLSVKERFMVNYKRLQMCARDADGKRVFNSADWTDILQFDPEVVDRVIQEAVIKLAENTSDEEIEKTN